MDFLSGGGSGNGLNPGSQRLTETPYMPSPTLYTPSSPMMPFSPMSSQQQQMREQQMKERKEREQKEKEQQQANIATVRLQMQQLQQHKELVKPTGEVVAVVDIEVTTVEGVVSPAPDAVQIQKELQEAKRMLEEEKENTLCSICMDRKKDTCLDCGHIFCHECISWLGGRHLCPICRKEFKTTIKLHL
ncbi:hypothetical protein SAMD00019534_063010 [Acytostelium subglobosum LB1]|uniref:hypothetical protein n=1 Tax=Acytostelium subglobosum LB1 TaxID=1410327 RepID=UPI00064519CD|nr:hypothetical protein SAMD00019534_063010 [Acytostelium subglobosum LB1]GAM23126.1 hypothetical protein SAMD00019534_063010 [Acytostelium subglobosum LB1]|eukprot:XP_012753575.1 hypothetical protein SAMD00019534_063010 [Acytostelium subglobosum LB1]